jgi:hypothetical protein
MSPIRPLRYSISLGQVIPMFLIDFCPSTGLLIHGDPMATADALWGSSSEPHNYRRALRAEHLVRSSSPIAMQAS